MPRRLLLGDARQRSVPSRNSTSGGSDALSGTRDADESITDEPPEADANALASSGLVIGDEVGGSVAVDAEPGLVLIGVVGPTTVAGPVVGDE